jgi:hypothetical protein
MSRRINCRRTLPRPLNFGLAFIAATAWQGTSDRAIAEPAQPSAVHQASYDRGADGLGIESVRFARRAPAVGDQLKQSLAVKLQLDTLVRQGGEVLEQTKTSIGRQQRRLVTTTEVDGGRATAAIVRYALAKKQLDTGPTKNDISQGPATPEPVEGKAYRCRRVADELQIVDSDGNIPPLDEFQIVARNMEWLGRPNPLAEFLAGRTVRVGESFELPQEVAEKLLGLGDTLGEVSRFGLTLDSVQAVDGTPCAVFRASIDAASSDSSQMRLQLDGLLVVETATCRAVQADLVGPIGMSETRGSLTATYQMSGTGKMTVHIASH